MKPKNIVIMISIIFLACAAAYLGKKVASSKKAMKYSTNAKENTAEGKKKANAFLPGTTPSEFFEATFTNLNNFYEVRLRWKDVTNIIFKADNLSSADKRSAVGSLKNTLFANQSSYTITNLIDICMRKRQEAGLSAAGTACSSLLVAMRYRRLIPYVSQKLLEDGASSNLTDAAWCKTWFGYIDHPEMLKTIVLLDHEIPRESPLRNGINPVWTSSIPFINRPDCLAVYLDIADNPGEHPYVVWVQAASMLSEFTNDTAVAGLSNAYNILSRANRYWKDHNAGFMAVANFKTIMKRQKERIAGTYPVQPAPQPVLDE